MSKVKPGPTALPVSRDWQALGKITAKPRLVQALCEDNIAKPDDSDRKLISTFPEFFCFGDKKPVRLSSILNSACDRLLNESMEGDQDFCCQMLEDIPFNGSSEHVATIKQYAANLETQTTGTFTEGLSVLVPGAITFFNKENIDLEYAGCSAKALPAEIPMDTPFGTRLMYEGREFLVLYNFLQFNEVEEDELDLEENLYHLTLVPKDSVQFDTNFDDWLGETRAVLKATNEKWLRERDRK